MTERPISFSAPLIRALLARRKTETRRALYRPYRLRAGALPIFSGRTLPGWPPPAEPPHKRGCVWGLSRWASLPAGALLWVREPVQATEREDGFDGVRYAADFAWRPIENTTQAAEDWSALFHYRGRGKDRIGNPVPAIHMPRWASRITLVVGVPRIEPLQAITEAGARAEGFGSVPEFRDGWDAIYGDGAWKRNPAVVVIPFTVSSIGAEAVEQEEVA